MPGLKNCCLTCYKILELFKIRHYSLVFKSEKTMDDLNKLKTRLIDQWSRNHIEYLLKLYKNGKKDIIIMNEINYD